MILFIEMREILFSVLPIIILLGTLFLLLSWYLNQSAKNRERLLMIEKGIDPKEIKSIIDKKNDTSWLRTGIVTIGIAIGYFICVLFEPGLGFGLIIILFIAGISMIIAHYLGKTKERQ